MCRRSCELQAKEDASELREKSMALKAEVAAAEEAATELAQQRDEAILPIGNIVHDSVPVDDDEVLVCCALFCYAHVTLLSNVGRLRAAVAPNYLPHGLRQRAGHCRPRDQHRHCRPPKQLKRQPPQARALS